MTAALSGKLAGRWNFNAYYTYGRATSYNYSKGQYNNQHLYAALDAVRDPASGATVCRVTLTNPTLLPGCVPFNAFDVNGPGAAAEDWARAGGFPWFRTLNRTDDAGRSEERRVGKEC